MQYSQKVKSEAESIIFFDGVCMVCNGFANFIIKRDTKNKFKLAPLQGETAKEKLKMSQIESLSTIVYLFNNQVFIHSTAVLKILEQLGGFWKLMIILRVIPRFVRDKIYQLIARNRYNWFGKQEACRIPLPSEKDKILL